MVQADKFCIDSTEVTNLQYQAFLTAKGSDTGGQITGCAGVNNDFAPKPSVDFPYAPERAGFPVVNVDWCDAVAYCQWAGKRLCGRIGGGSVAFTFQLDVSVNQWADACSDAGKKKFPYGDTYNANACYVKGGLADHVAAGSTKTCEGGVTGLFDMAGNVDEWIDSCRTTAAGDTCLVMGGSFQSAEVPQPGCGTWYEDKRMTPNQRRGFRCCN
jgi:formylglycine-generating enzyme required for sulfatase activity